MKILKVLGIILLFVVIAALGGGIYVNYALPNTGPAPEIKIDLTTARIERGRYLANHVTACMDCHRYAQLVPLLGTNGEWNNRKWRRII